MARVEVITGPERRRRWSEEQKRAIVAASLAPGAVISEVARRADVGAGQILSLAEGIARRQERVCAGYDHGRGGSQFDGRRAEIGCGAGDRGRVYRQGSGADTGLGPGGIGGGCGQGAVAAMIPVPSGVRVWLAVGHTDMRRGMNSLAVQVQEGLGRDPHAGDLYVFRGKRGHLVKIFWHDGIGMSLYAKRLERGRFIWPSPADGAVAITPAQLAYMLDGIDWRNPVRTWRPEAAG